MSKFFKILKMFNLYFTNTKKNIDIDWVEYNPELKSKSTVIPKKIWIYWDSDRPNCLVDLCIQRVRSVLFDFEIHVLNKDNISNYLDLPDFNKELPLANISDYIRLALLSKYGGIWMDASIFLNEDLKWILSKIHGYDAFLFYSDECTIDLKNPISENWFICAPENSGFIRDWFAEYSKCILSDNPKEYYVNVDRVILQNLSKPNYLLPYVSAIMVLKQDKYPILYARSGSIGHYYNYKYQWDGDLIAVDLLFKNSEQVTLPKLIKFNSSSRRGVERYLTKGLFNKKSLLGRYFVKKIGNLN
ncbi:capsular polysaccharide synthesis protein [Acinetobacter puyangensis]|uniref:capsular polysaccharide synthesis protein n=1 Tax=Acinetobacter puyangensis TaxID=1096779 RepID=UPI003A4E676F